jgi:hypothetical protein
MTTADYLNTHRYFGDEAEILGRRLDRARERSKQACSAYPENSRGALPLP